MGKLLQETNGVVFSTVSAIAEYCEVSDRAVRKLVADHKDTFLNISTEISEGISSSDLNVPELEFVTSDSGKNINWDKTKLYAPHIEFLLMLMKNSDIVTEHKKDIIVELFTLRVKSVIDTYEKKELQHQNNLLLLEKENKLLTERLSVKPKLECTNTNLNSRKARHEELMELVEKGCLDHEVKISTKYIYDVTEYGKSLGFYKLNGIIMFSGEEDGK